MRVLSQVKQFLIGNVFRLPFFSLFYFLFPILSVCYNIHHHSQKLFFLLSLSLVLSPELCNLVWQNKDHSWMRHHPVLISYTLPTGKAKHLCKLRVILTEHNCIYCHYTHYITARNRVFAINLCHKPKIPITFGLVSLSDFKLFYILQAYNVHAG